VFEKKKELEKITSKYPVKDIVARNNVVTIRALVNSLTIQGFINPR
jgi:hypothetical protein